MVDLAPYKEGIEAARKAVPQVCIDPRSDAIDFIRYHGGDVQSLKIGSIERIKGERCKGSEKDFWYVYCEIEDTQADGQVIGVLRCGYWKDSSSFDWTSRSQYRMNSAEKARFDAVREAMREQYEQDKIKKQEEAAKTAYALWQNAKEADNSHPYLVKKQVGVTQGIKTTDDGKLIIPIAVKNEITSLQFIDTDGSKRFLSGGKIKAGWFLIEGDTDKIYICEGYATGRSIHEATGKTVFIAFNAGNLYEVASHVRDAYHSCNICIAGDDDFKNERNAGRMKAEQAADALNLSCIFPQGCVDFNDMQVEHGRDALREYLGINNRIDIYKPEERKGEIADRPAGVLGHIYDYYNATSGNEQHGFAIQTALAIGSIALGRCYKTNYNNYPSLFLLNVGKSSTGKEHAKTVIEAVLQSANSHGLIAGDGYTSAGAVFSTLLDRPRHISVIDEFGRYLEAGRSMNTGSAHQREANTKLMESIGRAHSIMRPPSYSSMTLKKDAADAIKNRFVHNPHITLLTMTTPSTLFDVLDMGAVKDGFINRFIISISDAKRGLRKHKPMIEVPDIITGWLVDIKERNDYTHIAGEPAKPIELNFTAEAMIAQTAFETWCVDQANALEKFGMAELTGRGNEMSMRIALIYALSKNPYAETVDRESVEWATKYVKICLEKTIGKLKLSISSSDFEHKKKEILSDLRERGEDGITWANMQKNPPYSQHKPKELREIMDALKDANLAAEEPYKPQVGRPGIKWIALK